MLRAFFKISRYALLGSVLQGNALLLFWLSSFNVAPGAISGNNRLIFKTNIDSECSEAATQSIMQDDFKQDASFKAVCQAGKE